MTNEHGNEHGGDAGGAPQSAEGHLEEILNQITSQEAALFKEHMAYRTPQATRALRYDKFGNIPGGTEKLFDDIYHSAYQTATSKGLKAKKDDAAIADTLELVVVEALKKIGGQGAEHAWKNFELMKKEKAFRGDTERLALLQNLASEYLGANNQNIAALIQLLRSGDPGVWSEAVRNFTNHLKESLVDQYISQHLMKSLNNDNQHKWKAYGIRYMRETHGVTPDNLTRYMSTITPITQVMQHVEQVEKSKDKSIYSTMGLTEYKPPKQSGQAGGHGGGGQAGQ